MGLAPQAGTSSSTLAHGYRSYTNHLNTTEKDEEDGTCGPRALKQPGTLTTFFWAGAARSKGGVGGVIRSAVTFSLLL